MNLDRDSGLKKKIQHIFYGKVEHHQEESRFKQRGRGTTSAKPTRGAGARGGNF